MYWKHLPSLFLGFVFVFLFLVSQENLYMIHLYLNLFYEDYNAITQNFPTKKKLLPLNFSSNPSWCIYKRDSKSPKSSILVSFVSLTIIICILLLFVCMAQILSESLEDIKLIVIDNWIFHFYCVLYSIIVLFEWNFHSLWALWSFIIFFKYGLIY